MILLYTVVKFSLFSEHKYYRCASIIHAVIMGVLIEGGGGGRVPKFPYVNDVQTFLKRTFPENMSGPFQLG